MKYSTILAVVSSAALASAQFSFNSKTNSFTCATNGLAAYCAGGSIIIRCDDGIGLAGNCNDNLAGEPPVGLTVPAGCYQSSTTAGDAACTKGGLVYPGSGSGASSAAPYPIPGSIVPQVVGISNQSSAAPAGTTYKISMVGSGIGYHAHSTGISNATFTTHYKWNNATAAGTTVTVNPTVTVTVPCSDKTSTSSTSTAIVIPQPVTTAKPTTTTTATTTSTTASTSTTSSASASATVEVSTGGASTLSSGSLALVAAVALCIVF